MAFPTGSLAAVAASAAALITPTIDEFEQAYFYSSEHLHQEEHCRDAPLRQHSLPGLESIIDESLPDFSFYSPTIDASLEACVDYGTDRTCFMRIDSSSSSVASFTDTEEAAACDDITHNEEMASAHNATDVMQAAGILCQFKNDAIEVVCSSKETAELLVDMTVEILADDDDDNSNAVIDDDEQYCISHVQPGSNTNEDAESLIHPNRLAIDDDAEEVNKLHQYVRRELLEIFVIPQQTSSDADSDDEEEEEAGKMDDEATDDDDDNDEDQIDVKVAPKELSNGTTLRSLVTRRRSIEVTTVPPPCITTAQRYYPGRVGLRCTYCASIRRKSTTKAAFYPLRLKNIYREVCAWQRIHFKNCLHVPDGVRERYDHYKRIDTSRGKVRYWESSAKKIGLVNNPDRYVVWFVRPDNYC